jgi:AcrR family transcriptional regulator
MHDRRSRRTHQLLAEALIALISERRYAEVTVQDILNRANVGRTTFYRHYWDKDDLLASEMARVIDVLYSRVIPSANPDLPPIPSLEIFHHLQEQRALYVSLVRARASELLLSTLTERLGYHVEQHLRGVLTRPINNLVVQLTAYFLASTLTSLLRWWIQNDMLLSPAQMDALYRQLTLPGVRDLLQLKG